MEELTCPVCLDLLRDPFVTPCGHTFCHSCVTAHLQIRKTCPGCSQYLTADQVYPNHLLCKIAASQAKRKQMEKSTLLEKVQNTISSDGQSLQLSDVEALLEDLQEKRQHMQRREGTRSLEVLLHFLEHSRENKAERLSDLQDELSVLHKDIDQLHERKSAQMLNGPNQRRALPHAVPQPPHLLDDSRIAGAAGCRIVGANRGAEQPHGVAFTRADGGAERPLLVDGNLFPAAAVPSRDPLGNPEHQLRPASHIDLLRGQRETQPSHATSRLQGSPGQGTDTLQPQPSVQLPARAETLEAQVQARAAAFLRVPSFDQDGIPVLTQHPGEQSSAGAGSVPPHMAAAILLPSEAIPPGQPGSNALDGGTSNEAPHSGIDTTPNGRYTHLNGHVSSHEPESTATASHSTQQGGGASRFSCGSSDLKGTTELGSTASQKRGMEHFEDLQAQYFKMRQKQLQTMKRRRLGDWSGDSVHTDITPFSNVFTPDFDAERREDALAPTRQEDSSWLMKEEGIGDNVLPSVDRPDLQEFSRTLSLYSQHTRLEWVEEFPTWRLCLYGLGQAIWVVIQRCFRAS